MPTDNIAPIIKDKIASLASEHDFPALLQQVYGKRLVYLDSAASAQKPRVVVDAVCRAMIEDCANIHRGVHLLSARATDAYEQARISLQKMIGAADHREIIFVKGTTEAINLVAHSYSALCIEENDEIIISTMEHHSNIVPWQFVCQKKKARLRVIPMSENGELSIQAYQDMLNERTKLVAVTHVSNALGTVNPVKEIIDIAHQHSVPVLVDGAQAVPHMQVDVQALDCDFYAFSGHKMYGPTGVGILYAKERWLEAMPPYQGGGDMIASVSFEKTTYNELPYKFEAGTPPIASAIGLGAAAHYLQKIGFSAIESHDAALIEYACQALQSIRGVTLIGSPAKRMGAVSFAVEGVHPHDMGTILDREGVAIRTGHHCAQPIMDRLGIPATARASFALYNKQEDVDALVSGIQTAQRMFGV